MAVPRRWHPVAADELCGNTSVDTSVTVGVSRGVHYTTYFVGNITHSRDVL